MSRFNSIVLLVLYFFYLVFTMSEPAEEKSEEKSKLVSAADEAADGEEEAESEEGELDNEDPEPISENDNEMSTGTSC